MRSIRTKLIMLVLGSIIMASVAIGGAGLLNARRAVYTDSAKIMNLLCQDRAGQVNTMLIRVEQSVTTLASYAEGSLDDPTQLQTDQDYEQEYLARLTDMAINAAENTQGALTVYVRINPELAGPLAGTFWGRSAADGGFTSWELTDILKYDPEDREHVGWYYEPVANGRDTWMEPYYNQNIEMEIISYVVPYYQDGLLIGVVGMDIDFEVLMAVVAQTSVYQTGYAFLTNASAEVLYHKDIPQGTPLISYNGGEFAMMAESLSGENGGDSLLEYLYGGEHKKMAFQSLKNGMRMIIAAPASEIDASADLLMWQMSIAVVLLLLLAVTVTVWVTGRLVRPLIELTAAAQKIADGDLSVSIAHHSSDEVGVLADSFRATVAHLQTHIQYINDLAYCDPLTGVRNKTAYLERVCQIDQGLLDGVMEFGVVVFDINGLKAVNDSMGHELGDKLIIDSSRLVAGAFGQSQLYRIGGDEFAVILVGEDLPERYTCLERVEQSIAAHNLSTQEGCAVSVASGVAVFSTEQDHCYSDVFKRADSAMYRDKEIAKAAIRDDGQ